MKTCYRCKLEKPLSAFNKNSYYSDGLSHSCRSCISETTYKPKKEYLIAYSGVRSRELRKKFQDYKSTLCCSKCGESRHWVLDFHHLESNQKESEVADLVRRGRNFESIKLEIAKCIPLCRNCHADLHYQERQYT